MEAEQPGDDPFHQTSATLSLPFSVRPCLVIMFGI